MSNLPLDSLFKLVHSLKRNIQEQIEALALDLSLMHVHVLKIIANKPDCTAIDIAHGLERDKAQVTRLLNALLKQELIIKAANPKDKRSQCLYLSKQGRKVMESVEVVDNAVLDKMQQGITAAEMKAFQKIAQQLTNNLTRD